MKDKKKILITGFLHESVLKTLTKMHDFEINYRPDCPRKEIFQEVRHVDCLITRSETTVDSQVIDQASRLKLIIRACVGVANVDIKYATKKGILVVNAPGKNTNSAAELTFGLLFSMLRKIPEAMSHVRNGGWNRHLFSGTELRGKRLGIIGLGNVGRRLARFARGLEMEVSSYDPYISPLIFERLQVKRFESLQKLAAVTDILSCHVPLNEETKSMVSKEILGKLPQGSYVLNAARGGIVDEAALLDFLTTSHLAGYAVDTWCNEPSPNKKLLSHPKVYGTPHIGASTSEAQLAVGKTVVLQIKKFFAGGVVDYPVNLPKTNGKLSPILAPYTVLGEKLGYLASQISNFNPCRLTLKYRGELAHLDSEMIKRGVMKGYSSNIVENYVSYVNAGQIFEKLGIIIDESKDPEFDDYRSALRLSLSGQNAETLAVGGTVFDEQYLRISLIENFAFEVEPNGFFLMVKNLDRPGVIGQLGGKLAEHKINIDSFSLSRTKIGADAMALIRTDQKVGKKVILDLEKLDNITAAQTFQL